MSSIPSLCHIIPIPFTNPHLSEHDAFRLKTENTGTLGVGIVSSAVVLDLLAGKHLTKAVPPLKATTVLRVLLAAREGMVAVWPPSAHGGADNRRATIQQLAQYNQVRLAIRKLPDATLLVSIQDRPPSAEVELISPIKAEQLFRKGRGFTPSPLRPSDPKVIIAGAHQDYEPYPAYVDALVRVHNQDLGAGVVYPYHNLRSRAFQQSRLHHEAGRQGMTITVKKLDDQHLLIRFKDQQAIIVRDKDQEPDPETVHTGVTGLPPEETSMEDL